MADIRDKIALFLKTLPAFANLSGQNLFGLASLFQLKVAKKETIIYSEGDGAKGAYLIVKGEVGVYKKKAENSSESLIAVYKKNMLFGHLALIDEGKEHVTCKAQDDVFLLYIEKKIFFDFFTQGSASAFAFQHMVTTALIRQLRIADELLAKISNQTPKKVTQQSISSTLKQLEELSNKFGDCGFNLDEVEVVQTAEYDRRQYKA